MIKTILSFLLPVLICACSPGDYRLPEKVSEVLDNAGENRQELQKVIDHYKNSRDIIGEEAAYFLIGNMEGHGYLTYRLTADDHDEIPFNVLDFNDYNDLLDGWDSLEMLYGELRFKKDTFIRDVHSIPSEFLIRNIDLAYEAWDGMPWASHIDFDRFCEYILPYRGSNEPLEPWRAYFWEELQWVMDSVSDPSDPVDAAVFVNEYIKSWFRFDPRFYEHPTDQGLSEMLEHKKGRCEDMTNLAIYAMRAIAIPVMSDFTPYWANTGNNHAWNAIINKEGDVIIFMGGEANPGAYSLPNKLAKVYRKTYAACENTLVDQLGDKEKAPPYLDRKNILDVTDEYVPTSSVYMELLSTPPYDSGFAYICVFNSGKWKAIDYSRIDKKKVHFRNMGNEIAYLPAYYHNQKVIPAGNAFILDSAGAVNELTPHSSKKISFTIDRITRVARKESSDINTFTPLRKGEDYSLYLWDGEWVIVSTRICTGREIEFTDVPEGALYRLTHQEGRDEERMFTVTDQMQLRWW